MKMEISRVNEGDCGDGAALSAEEVRRRRLAYFSTANDEKSNPQSPPQSKKVASKFSHNDIYNKTTKSIDDSSRKGFDVKRNIVHKNAEQNFRKEFHSYKESNNNLAEDAEERINDHFLGTKNPEIPNLSLVGDSENNIFRESVYKSGNKDDKDEFAMLRDELKQKSKTGDEAGYSDAVERLIKLAKKEIAESENQKILSGRDSYLGSSRNSFSVENKSSSQNDFTLNQSKSGSQSFSAHEESEGKVEYSTQQEDKRNEVIDRSVPNVTDKYEQFFIRDSMNPKKSHQNLRQSYGKELRDSQDMDGSNVFHKSVDFGKAESLGLLTHRPDSPDTDLVSSAYVPKNEPDEQTPRDFEGMGSADPRIPSEEKKYQEFLQKSMNNFGLLHQDEPVAKRNNLSNSSKHSKNKLESQSDLKTKPTDAVKEILNNSISKPVSILKNQNKTSNPGLKLNVRSSGEKNEDVRGFFSRSESIDSAHDTGTDSNVNRPLLNRPRYEPSNIYQQGGMQDADGVDNLSLPPSYRQGYEKTSVARNVVFTANEIYQQAFKGQYISPQSSYGELQDTNISGSPVGRGFSVPVYPQAMYQTHDKNPQTGPSPQNYYQVPSPGGFFGSTPPSPASQYPFGHPGYPMPIPHPPSRGDPNVPHTSFRMPHPPPTEGGDYQSYHQQSARSYQTQDGVDMSKFVPHHPPKMPHPPPQNTKPASFGELGQSGEYPPRYFAPNVSPSIPPHMAPMFNHYPPDMSIQIPPWGTGDMSDFKQHFQQIAGGIPYPPPPYNVDLNAYLQYLGSQGYPVPYHMYASQVQGTHLKAGETTNTDQQQPEPAAENKVADMMIPHPPLHEKKETSDKPVARKSSPQRNSKQDVAENISKSSQRHIDGIRMFHEQRRQQDAEEDVVLEKQRKFAKASIDRYFCSLEKLYRRDKHGDVGEKLDDSPYKSDECLEEEEDILPGSDVEGETLVNTEVTAATSVKAEGITERIDRLGIDLSFLKASVTEDDAPRKTDSQEDEKESVDTEKKSKSVKICPECGEINKAYMSWCGECREVLIGIEPTVVKKTKSGKIVQKPKIKNHFTKTEKSKKVEESDVSQVNNEVSENCETVNNSEKNKLSPNKSDSRDSGRPSSDDLDITRSEKEVAEICETITDPIVKGFIKSYFRKKRADVVEKHEHGSQVKNSKEVEHGTFQEEPDKPNEDHKKIHLPANEEDVTAKLLDSEGNFWLHEQPQKRRKSKPLKKGNSAPIDIEIFAVEESRQSRNSSRGSQPIVPTLNLVNSSDEEDASASDQPNEISVFESIESSVLEEYFDPAEEVRLPSPEQAEASQPFLAQVIDDLKTPVPKKSANKSPNSKKPRPVRKSIVRESIDSSGYQRKWEKSSTAWASYHPRELSTKSSLNKGRNERPNSASTGHQVPRRSGSADNLLDQEVEENRSVDRKGPVAGRKPRPVSADISKRRATPSSSQYKNRKSPKTVANSISSGNSYSSPVPNYDAVPDPEPDIPRTPDISVTPDSSNPEHPSINEPSTTWASYNFQAPSSNPPVRGRGNRPASATGGLQSGRRTGSTDNLLPTEAQGNGTFSRKSSTGGNRQRPGSADVSKRRQMASNTQVKNPRSSKSSELKPNVSLNLDSPTSVLPGVVDHRLPSTDVAGDVDVPHSDPTAALKTYSKYHEMTPRIRDGDFSVWLCLPDEILLHIFSYLSRSDLVHCAQTCKQYHRVAMDDSLWRYITLKKNHNLTDDSFVSIGKHHPISLALIQCHGDNVTAKGLRDMFKECSNSLRELNLCGSSRGALTGDCVLLHASARCKNITHIDASWCNVTDSGIGAISSASNRLESLCINGCQLISDEGLETVIKKHGQSLRVLEMFGCFNITPKGMRYLASNCVSLLTLNLGQCYKLTDSCITQLSSSLGRVENLDLRGCKHIKDNSIRFVVKNCPRLKMISLANCPNVSDVSMLEISTYLNDIRMIDVCGCRNITDSSIRAIANNCQNLRNIDISSTGCTHRSVSMLANFCSQRLETVKLNFLSDITENSILKLVKHCRRLKLLHLYGCTSIRTLDKIKQAKPDLKVEM